MLNKIIIQGRLTKDVEMRQTSTGTAYCSLSIACSRGKNKEGVEETDFLNAIAWASRAEFINRYFKKGDMILIEGRMQSRNYEDSNGNKRVAYDISISEVNFCGGGSKSAGNNQESAGTVAPDIGTAVSEDIVDLPFDF